MELLIAADTMMTRVETLAPSVAITHAIETSCSRAQTDAPLIVEHGRPIDVRSDSRRVERIEHADQRFAQAHKRRLLVVRDGAPSGPSTPRDLMRALDRLRSYPKPRRTPATSKPSRSVDASSTRPSQRRSASWVLAAGTCACRPPGELGTRRRDTDVDRLIQSVARVVISARFGGKSYAR